MHVCIACNRSFESDHWTCPDCGYAPAVINDSLAFAPELAQSNIGYNPECFAQLEESFNESLKSYWFISRNQLFVWAAKKYFPQAANLLEIGCGIGTVLSHFHQYCPDLELSGFELFSQGLRYVPVRVPGAFVFQADARRIPFDCEFDIIAAFDVLEHVDEDELVLQQMYQATRPGGGILLSVPHHHFMWSQRDEYLCHKRRYTRTELIEKTRRAGFNVLRASCFVSIPFPAMVLEKLLNHKTRQEYDPFKALFPGKVMNFTLTQVLALERLLIKAGLSFQFGGSLLLVAQRN